MVLQTGRRRRVCAGIAVVIAVPVAVLASYALSFFEQPAGEFFPVAESMTSPGYNTPLAVPGIRLPATVSATAADLADDEAIIGIEVDGRHRAYRVSALSGAMGHVVNDLIEKVPVTVTYCNLQDCVRAFTDEKHGEALEVSTAGLLGGNLLLRSGDVMFSQPTGEGRRSDGTTFSPLPNHPFTRTTWKAWRDLHPDTDVYVGSQNRS